METVHWLLLLSVFSLSSSSICNLNHNIGEYLCEPPTINLTRNNSDTILYTRLCEWSVQNGSDIIVKMTRYCYCQQSKSDDPDNESCSVPGPTLVMHDYTNINVTVVNELEGSHVIYNQSSKYWNKYKDMDITNIHVHGLHVSPFIDDILLKIPPQKSQPYPYQIGYHYPGTFWYHAHHHGSTTWQVNMGLHGAILMNQDNDTTAIKYKENVLMFEWFYIVPSEVCIDEDNKKSCNHTKETAEYAPRFPTSILGKSSAERATGSNVGANYAMCDVYCSFPVDQRNASQYVYDVTTDLSYTPVDFNTSHGNQRLMYFFTNGQLSPIIKMTKGEYRRLRMINSLSNWYLQFQFPDQCQWYLIATDGVYIGGTFMNYNLSRESHNYQYLIAPGGRADIMVKCAQNGTYDILSTNSTSQDPTLEGFTERIYNGIILFSLQVNDPDTPIIDGTDQLPSKVPPKKTGTYIENLSNHTPRTECRCNYHDAQSTACQFTLEFDKGVGTINNKPFGVSEEYQNESLTLIKLNEAYEFMINDNGNLHPNNTSFNVSHVYHQHINPFQVQTNIGKNGFIALNTTWWDTLGNLPQNENERIRMRFWTRDYYGLIILHCHLLQHEDKGMMGYYGIEQMVPKTCPNQPIIPTKAPTTKSPTEPCIVDNKLHFAFILDEGGALKRRRKRMAYFNNVIKPFTQTVIERDVNDESDIAIIVDDKNVNILHKFTDTQKPRDDILNKLSALDFDAMTAASNGDTLNAAIQEFINNGYTSNNIIFLVSDCKYSSSPCDEYNNAQRLRDNGITLVTIVATDVPEKRSNVECSDYFFQGGIEGFTEQDFDNIVEAVQKIGCDNNHNNNNAAHSYPINYNDYYYPDYNDNNNNNNNNYFIILLILSLIGCCICIGYYNYSELFKTNKKNKNKYKIVSLDSDVIDDSEEITPISVQNN